MDKPIALTHPFVQEIPDVDEFFRSNNEAGHINTINGFCERVKALSAKYAPVPDPEDKAKSKYKGGAGEVLAEFLIKDMGHENRIGIFDYRPVNANDDTGVDGEGFGANGKPATVQVKFREGGWILRANEDHLSNFIAASQNKYHVCPEDDKNMLIITTGLKVDEFTMQEMLYGKVRCLNREALREMMDNRPNAWLRFYEAWKSSRIQQVAPVITKVLRDNQVEAVDAMAGKTKGVIVRPTGTGKSLIMAEKIYRTITEELAAHRFPVIKVNTPRIILNFQDFEEIFKYLNERGIVAKYVNFCSGSTEEKEYRELLAMSGHYLPRDVTDTTSTQRVLIEHDRAKREGVPFIVISTYNSSEKFAKSGIVPTITCHDEAHRLVSKEFCDVHMQQSGADFFFTATPRITKPSEITDTERGAFRAVASFQDAQADDRRGGDGSALRPRRHRAAPAARSQAKRRRDPKSAHDRGYGLFRYVPLHRRRLLPSRCPSQGPFSDPGRDRGQDAHRLPRAAGLDTDGKRIHRVQGTASGGPCVRPVQHVRAVRRRRTHQCPGHV